MFVRTERLTLRPAWREDAGELCRAIGHEAVVRNLSKVPWPYTLGEAEAFVERLATGGSAFFLICEHVGGKAPIVGGIGLHPQDDGNHQFGYWLAPHAWGRGIATEAGRAVLRTARETLRLRHVVSGHFVDNPASGRVLRKLGFRPTGRIEPRQCVARGVEVPTATFELELCSADADNDPRTRMAA